MQVKKSHQEGAVGDSMAEDIERLEARRPPSSDLRSPHSLPRQPFQGSDLDSHPNQIPGTLPFVPFVTFVTFCSNSYLCFLLVQTLQQSTSNDSATNDCRFAANGALANCPPGCAAFPLPADDGHDLQAPDPGTSAQTSAPLAGGPVWPQRVALTGFDLPASLGAMTGFKRPACGAGLLYYGSDPYEA